MDIRIGTGDVCTLTLDRAVAEELALALAIALGGASDAAYGRGKGKGGRRSDGKTGGDPGKSDSYGRTGSYGGKTGTYSGKTDTYSGRTDTYSGKPDTYGGKPGTYSGQPDSGRGKTNGGPANPYRVAPARVASSLTLASPSGKTAARSGRAAFGSSAGRATTAPRPAAPVSSLKAGAASGKAPKKGKGHGHAPAKVTPKSSRKKR